MAVGIVTTIEKRRKLPCRQGSTSFEAGQSNSAVFSVLHRPIESAAGYRHCAYAISLTSDKSRRAGGGCTQRRWHRRDGGEKDDNVVLIAGCWLRCTNVYSTGKDRLRRTCGHVPIARVLISTRLSQLPQGGLGCWRGRRQQLSKYVAEFHLRTVPQ